MRIILFTSDSCSPCRRVNQYLNSGAYNGPPIITMDARKFRDIAIEYSITSIPTLFVDDNGEERKFHGADIIIDHLKSLK